MTHTTYTIRKICKSQFANLVNDVMQKSTETVWFLYKSVLSLPGPLFGPLVQCTSNHLLVPKIILTVGFLQKHFIILFFFFRLLNIRARSLYAIYYKSYRDHLE